MCQEVSCRDQYLFIPKFAGQIVMQNSLIYMYHFVRNYNVVRYGIQQYFFARKIIKG